MELTIEQALRQGIAAHKEGKLQDAERLYRAILQSQPTHPDANHNLGVLAVGVGKVQEEVPFFKLALDTNPEQVQFWLSYVDALIKLDNLDGAKQVLKQAKEQGVDKERLNALQTQLKLTTQVDTIKLNSRKKHGEAGIPTQKQLTSLSEHYQNGRLSDAEKLAVEITQNFPKHQFSWKVLGAVLGQTGRKSEAVDANQTAVALSPQDAEAHSNLGNTLKELDRLEEALASFNPVSYTHLTLPTSDLV